AAGGGHSLHVTCDLTLASRQHARFKQTDADVGSFDGGFGSAYLARQTGQKFAREIFFLGRAYDAETMYQMGAVNEVVDHAELESVGLQWAAEINGKSPQAIRMLKFSFNLIDDGLVELRADRIVEGAVECSVVVGGTVTSHKGMNLPGTAVSAPTLTEKDREDLRFGVAQGVDYIALSFVRGAEDVLAAKRLIADCGGDVPIIAKIERHEAVSELEAILTHADGVMVARGDLGVEMGPEAVPVLQKRIIASANRRRRLVITATQMLESMTRHTRPTRAEASDVANAVFDGTDAVMLSAETAIGQYPVETVRVMDRIVRAAEVETEPGAVHGTRTEAGQLPFPEAICLSASSAAAVTGAAAIVAFSERGATARLVSKQRPVASIIAFTPFVPIRQRMALYWGVVPHTMAQIPTTDERVAEAERRLKAEGLVQRGQRLVILSGTRVGEPGGTNLMKLHEVS
ncbi:pyruvate kinase, partial [Nitrospirales bacterium NOB]|nr:pyruvate kinase [Nitrospirales bacterium NOB]